MKNLTIFDLAEWFLNKESMTHKKLQKLCYYAVAWGYALMHKKIVEHDEFQAWIHGPVSQELYKKYKDNGWNNIKNTEINKPDFPNDIEELLESVWVTYGKKGGNELEALSHSERPWKEARIGLDTNDRSCKEIDVKVMEEFYSSIYIGD